MNLRDQLEAILSESRASALERASAAFDKIAGSETRPIVIFGAGKLGRTIVSGLRAAGRPPIAFADNNQALWEKPVDGITVLPPASAAVRYGKEAVFIIAVSHFSRASVARDIAVQLRGLGCDRVVAFPVLYWKYPRVFLPYYFWDLPSRLLEEAAGIRSAFALLADRESRIEFVEQCRFRSYADFECLPPPAPEPQYFPPELFEPSLSECFVDCGAYNGDTLRSFLEWSKGNFQKFIAFEADPENFHALQKAIHEDGRAGGKATALPVAVGSTCGKVRFSATGSGDAAITAEGGTDVECATLDAALEGERPTFVKMDIEGTELDALHGARNIIARREPILAVCAYHRQDHLWQVPLTVARLLPGASIFLRRYSVDGWDLVCYAIPRNRLTWQANP